MRLFNKQRLYCRVHSDEVLTEAWRAVRASSQAAGIDGVTVPQFESRVFINLKRLQHELADRTYTPQAVKRLSLAKTDGRRRMVGILTVRDRIVQRAVLEVIQPIFEADFEEISYGYRPGRSIEGALDHTRLLVQQGYVWAVDLDIESFFDRISINPLYRAIRDRLQDRALLRLIDAWLELGALSVEQRGLWRRTQRRGLLQGSVLSPLFANIYLDRFDKLARQARLKIIRYADDILILARSREEADAALAWARRVLCTLKLELNRSKTTISHAAKGFDFLGHRLRLCGSNDRSELEGAKVEILGSSVEGTLPHSGSSMSSEDEQGQEFTEADMESVLIADDEEGDEWDDDLLRS